MMGVTDTVCVPYISVYADLIDLQTKKDCLPLTNCPSSLLLKKLLLLNKCRNNV